MQSGIDFNNEYNWLKVITRKSKRSTHPLRHLLLIGFLSSDIEGFFFEEINVKKSIVVHEKNKRIFVDDRVIEYRKSIKDFIRINKEISRNQIRKNLNKEYIYLYRHDCDWLLDNLPKKKEIAMRNVKRVNWNIRDIEYLQLLKKRYSQLFNGSKIVRITKGTLGKPLGILANLEKNIDKLPKTKEYLNDVCESVRDFQIRRCKYVISNKFINKGSIKLWEVQRTVGIRTNEFNEIKSELQQYINKIRGE